MNELALFAGAGGGILGGILLGWNCIGAVEIEKYPRKVLLARQCDGLLPEFPIWDDVRSFDGKPWRGLVDVVSGGFPCQDISCAGKGVGIGGARSGLWAEMHRIICEVRPRFAFMENSPMLTSRGLGRVLGDLAEAGYDACWTCLSASDCGAPHRRERIWILAHDANTDRMQRPEHGQQHQRPQEPAGCRADGVESRAAMAHPELQRLQGGHPRPAEGGIAPCGGETAQPQPAGSHKGNIPNSNQLRRRTPPASGDIQAEQPHVMRVRGASGGCRVPDSASGGQAIRLQADAGEHSEKSATAPAESGARCTASPHPDMPGCEKQRQPEPAEAEQQAFERGGWWSAEPNVGRMANGVANRVDRLKSLGNGQVPIVAATAFRILYRQLTNQEYQP